MSVYTHDDVLKAIKHLFPDENPEDILDLISEYGSEERDKEPHRVRLAILKISQGDMDQLLEAVDLAKTDYRDVLVGAEYENTHDDFDKWTEIKNPYKDILS